MNMHLRQLKYVLMVITLMRGLITDHRIEHSWPRQDNSTEYCEKVSHAPHSTLLTIGGSNGTLNKAAGDVRILNVPQGVR